MDIYVKFTTTTHHHMTLTSNSKNFYFSPNSVLNFRKCYQIWGKLAQEQKRYRQKTNWGWKTTPPPPVLIGLKDTSRRKSPTKMKTKRKLQQFTVSVWLIMNRGESGSEKKIQD